MTIKEIKKDLFTMPNDYALAHCISADFALGAGIAKEFDKRFNCRKRLFDLEEGNGIGYWDNGTHGYCILIGLCENPIILNLVTKRNYWDKPTLITIKNALSWMKKHCEMLDIHKVAMPRICCGLDRQDWTEVKKLIEEVFDDADIEILVCVK